MSHCERKPSEADLYHVVARGVSRQIIFEDDHDRRHFLTKLHSLLDEDLELLAWCLMSNHVHLLFHGEIKRVSKAMLRLESDYARYFNNRHGRVGHLFQDRFHSEPIHDESYLATVVRYIHDNPAKAGICEAKRYRWSSYRDYMTGRGISNTRYVIEALGGLDAFRVLHELSEVGVPRLTDGGMPGELDDDYARRVAAEIMGEKELRAIGSLERDARNSHLLRLLEYGFSIRQLERITGVSRGILQRLARKRDN